MALTGISQAYDSHCNLVLGEVEETIYVVEEDEDEQEIIKVYTLLGYLRSMSKANFLRR